MALWRIRATVDDRPGYLSVLTASLALRAVNILAVQVHTTEAGAVDDFLVDAPDAMTERELQAAVAKGRGRDAWIAPAQAQGLADQPTQALALASRLVRDPYALDEVLAAMFGVDGGQAGGQAAGQGGGTTVTWRPAPGPARYGFHGTTMRLPDPAGGEYEVSRAAPAFTPAEYARAQAMVDLAGSVAGAQPDGVTLLLPDGTELTLRPARLADLAELQAMHARCSAPTRQRRYLSGSPGPTLPQLRRLIDPARATALVATVSVEDGPDGERIVALANLVGEGDLGEVALLVEDGWQRRGLGTALLRRLASQARHAGYAAIVAHAQADNAPMLRTLRRLGGPIRCELDGPLLTVTLPLARASAPEAATPPVSSPRPAASA
jgi:GNAT superfamily N-acetyltransferase